MLPAWLPAGPSGNQAVHILCQRARKATRKSQGEDLETRSKTAAQVRALSGALVRGAPGAVCVVVFVYWVADQGGYPATIWYAGALVVLGVFAALVAARLPDLLGAPRTTWWAIALLAGFTAWSFASIAWADSKGDAWDGANRTLLYLLVYALFARWRWRPEGAALLLGAFSAGVAAIGLVTLQRIIHSGDPVSFLIGSRLTEPLGYPNATAAIFLLAFWPAVFLGSSRDLHPVLRGVCLALAGALLELSLIPQSRGALLSLPVVTVLYVVLAPTRARAVLHLGLVGLVAAIALHPLLGVYRTGSHAGDVAGAVTHARNAILLSMLALTVAGVCAALLDARLELSRGVQRRIDRALAVVAAIAAIVGIAVLFAAGSPASHARSIWHTFKSPEPAGGSSHFIGLGSNRYDFYRVALLTFERKPVGGAGADNFGIQYLRERRSTEEPLYAHSLEMRLLVHTGIVGTLLFAGFLAAALLAAWRSRSRGVMLKRGAAAAATAAFAYWFVHGSGDWLWEFPALSAPAFAWLGLAAGLDRPDESVAAPPRRSLWAFGPLAALVALAAAGSLALPWLAAREVDSAAHTWRTSPEHAFAALGRARTLNPLSDLPDITTGAIASRLDERGRMRIGYTRAIARNPANWYSRLELGVLYGAERKYPAAIAELRRARELNPREPLVGLVLRRVRERRPLQPQAVDRIILSRANDTTH